MRCYWHRPLVAYRSDVTGEVTLVPNAPLGYLMAYSADRPRLDKPIELWPRLHRRPILLGAMSLYENGGKDRTTARNLRKLFDAQRLYGSPLPRSFAKQHLTLAKAVTLEEWLDIVTLASLRDKVQAPIPPTIPPPTASVARTRPPQPPHSLTYERTARWSFEVAYWKTIATLAEGRFLNNNNGDCVSDSVIQQMLPYHERHLEPLGDFLLDDYRKHIAAAGMAGKALAGEMPFQWKTDFDFSWMGGWLKNQEEPAERNLDNRHSGTKPKPNYPQGRPLRPGLHDGLLRQELRWRGSSPGSLRGR